jgi:hypothetical protein
MEPVEITESSSSSSSPAPIPIHRGGRDGMTSPAQPSPRMRTDPQHSLRPEEPHPPRIQLVVLIGQARARSLPLLALQHAEPLLPLRAHNEVDG